VLLKRSIAITKTRNFKRHGVGANASAFYVQHAGFKSRSETCYPH